jgi:hypothetical protein
VLALALEQVMALPLEQILALDMEQVQALALKQILALALEQVQVLASGLCWLRCWPSTGFGAYDDFGAAFEKGTGTGFGVSVGFGCGIGLWSRYRLWLWCWLWKRYRRWLRRQCALFQKVKKLYLGKVLEKSDFLSNCLREDSYKRENHEKIVCKYCKIALISYIRTDL